jgi:ATP-dependent helicase/nuclease subunit A
MSEAALDPRTSVSVSASAGSGKTWLLTSRVLRLMLEGMAPSGILALTFTRKAASEMRLRVNERLRAMARADDGRLDELLRELGLVPAAELRARARALYRELLFTPFPPRLMTLHAFCQDLLGRFALEARVPPGFSLIESEGALFRQAWRSVQADIVRRPDSTTARALDTLIGLGLGDFGLEQLVFTFLAHRGDWWAYTQGQEDPLAFANQRLGQQLDIQPGMDPLAPIAHNAFNGWLTMLYRWLRDWGNVGSVRAERLAPAMSLRGAERLSALRSALYGEKGAYKFEPGRKFTEAQRKSLLECYGEVFSAVQEASEAAARQDAFTRSSAAYTLGAAVLAALDAELARRQALTFTDLEWRAYQLLRRDGAAEWVRYKLDQKIDHLLIDEFQDTSSTQWRMLLPLLEEMAAAQGGGDRTRSLFVVGDGKQSIYGFRRANPRLLNTAEQWIVQELRGRAETLNRSRRSSPGIIAFVNALFRPDELRQPLRFTQHETHCGHLWGRVEIAPSIDQDDDPDDQSETTPRDPLQTPRRIREDLRAAREGALVAQRIRALVESNVAISPADSPPRALGYGDVLVLARARTHLHHLEHALTAADIPFIGAARGTLLITAEARDLSALLRWLDAPHRDLELAQVLRSPLFSLGDDLLIGLAREVGAHGGTWADALRRLAAQQKNLRRPQELLDRWLGLAARLPVHDLLDRILRESDMAACYEQALPKVAAARARANLGALLQLALEADSGRHPSVPRFLRYLEDQARIASEAPDEPPPAAASGMVRVLTVHAAKGLEAPAVFVVNSGRLLSPRPRPLLVEWPDQAERPTHMLAPGDSGARDALSERLVTEFKARETLEDLNLLYVAVTRARQFLHISGFSQINQGERLSWHDHALRAAESIGADTHPPLPGATAGALCCGVGDAPLLAAGEPAPDAPAADPRLRRPLKLKPGPEPASAPSATVATVLGGGVANEQAVQRGIAIHFLLQKLSEARPVAASDLQTALSARLNTPVTPPQFKLWQTEAAQTLESPALARFFDPARYRRAWNEVPVMGAQPGSADHAGVMDRLVDDGETLWVLDYKTHPAPDAPALAAQYREQLDAYARAVATAWPGRPVRAGLLLTATRSWVPVIE